MQSKEKTTVNRELGKAMGINIVEIKPETEKARQEALQKATSAIKNKLIPILNPNFKTMVKERVMQEIKEGTPKEKIQEEIKIWIGQNIEQLQKIR